MTKIQELEQEIEMLHALVLDLEQRLASVEKQLTVDEYAEDEDFKVGGTDSDDE